MGCCQVSLEIEEAIFAEYNEREANTMRVVKTEADFSDISLDSHEGEIGQMLETSKTLLGESVVYNTRPTSISLHRIDIEAAFLQTSGILRRNTVNFSTTKDEIV